MPPLSHDFINVFAGPDAQLRCADLEACFFRHLSNGGVRERFIPFTATGDRLPVTGVLGTLEEQDLQRYYEFCGYPFLCRQFRGKIKCYRVMQVPVGTPVRSKTRFVRFRAISGA